MRDRAVGDVERVVRASTCSSWYDDGANIVMPGTFDSSTMSSTPWCDGAVVAGDAGPVEAEHDRLAVQADVEVDLVEGPGEERRVDRDDRAQPAHRHAGGGGDRVLLGDADVEEAVGEALAERQQAGRAGHGRGDGDELGVRLGRLDQRLGERRGVRLPPACGRRVEPDVVQALDRRRPRPAGSPGPSG